MEFKKNLPLIFAFSIFFIVGLFTVFHHEIQRDEAQTWMMGIHVNLWQQHLDNYERTPLLWYSILHVVGKFTHNVVYMQLLHFAIALVTAFLILFYSPFNKPIRIMMIFGYFFSFEFLAISRNYAIGIMLIFLILALFKKRPIIAFVLNLLLANSNIIGTIISVFLFILIFRTTDNKKLKILLTAMFLLNLLAVAYIAYPKQPMWVSEIVLRFDVRQFGRPFAALMRAFVPIPELKIAFYDSLFLNQFSEYYSAIGGICFLLALLTLRRYRFPFLVFSIPILLFNFFLSTIIRHSAYIFILFIVCLWLELIENKELLKVKWKKTFIILIISLQILAAIIAVYYEERYNFSSGKDVADYIRENNLSNKALVVSPFMPAAPIAAYLDKPVYGPNTNQTWFTIWAKDRYDYDASIKVCDMLDRFKGGLLIISTGLNLNCTEKFDIIKRFEPSIFEEDFILANIK
ncbi:MAG: hypothetical protein KJ955_03405 [Nanoarchaeota archaeon]|nr:hypothetical protein [Nanoarchaeota archaeon]